MLAPSGSWRSGIVAAVTSAAEGGFGFEPVEMTCHPGCLGSLSTGSAVADEAIANGMNAAVASKATRTDRERAITGLFTRERC